MASKLSIEITASFYLHLSLLLIILPLPWVVSIVSAAFLHELFHILALRLYRIEIHKIELRSSGAYISTRCLTPCEQIFCAAAGPLGELFMASAFHALPRFALCAFIQGVYNLMPFLPFDGGRVLSGICACLPTKLGIIFSYLIKIVAVIVMIVCFAWLTIYVKVIN